MKIRWIALALLAASGCVQVISTTPVATGGSRGDGIVEMSYDFAPGPTIQPNWPAASGEALRRCQAWGYTKVESFSGRVGELPGTERRHLRRRDRHPQVSVLRLTRTGAARPSIFGRARGHPGEGRSARPAGRHGKGAAGRPRAAPVIR